MIPTPGDGGQSLTGLILAMPGQEPLIKRLDLPDERMKLLGQERHCRLRDIWQHCAVRLLDSLDEITAPAHAFRCGQSELGTMSADRIDQHGALADKQFARAVQDEYRLPLRALGRHEARGRAPYRLADRLGIGSAVLLAPKIGLHIRRRHLIDHA